MYHNKKAPVSEYCVFITVLMIKLKNPAHKLCPEAILWLYLIILCSWAALKLTNDTICYHRKLWSDETENGFYFYVTEDRTLGLLAKIIHSSQDCFKERNTIQIIFKRITIIWCLQLILLFLNYQMFMMKNLWGQKFKLLESFAVKNNFLKFNLVTAPTWECIGIYLCKLSNELCGLWGESFHNILTLTWMVLLLKFRKWRNDESIAWRKNQCQKMAKSWKKRARGLMERATVR